jgi:hypothetical protein
LVSCPLKPFNQPVSRLIAQVVIPGACPKNPKFLFCVCDKRIVCRPGFLNR